MSGEHEKDRPAIRHEYERLGAREFYARHGSDYRNPHEAQIRAALHQAVREWSLDLSHVLDLAAGSGEVTLALRELGAGRIDAIDPFTIAAYAARTGRTAERHTFEQIAQGALSGKSWRLIVCSFALHLVEPSRLPALAYQLSLLATSLIVLTPHKRPILRPDWGWQQVREMLVQRVRVRLYETRGTGASPVSSEVKTRHG